MCLSVNWNIFKKIKTYILKHITLLIFSAFNLLACHSPSYISGTLEGNITKEVKIYLIEPQTLQEVSASYFGKIIDSATVNPDGSFDFYNKPKTNEPILLELAIQQYGKAPNYLQTDNPKNSNFIPIVWQQGEQFKITAKLDEFQKSFSMENPSEVNKNLLELRDIHQKAYESYLEGKHWEVEDGSQLLEKEHAILQYQTELIKFADSTSYLLPSLVALRLVSPESDYERVPEFLVRQCEKWKKNEPNHPWVEELCNQSNPYNLPVLVGDEFPEVKLPTLSKDTISIKDNLGKKLTIIDLWASWCAPCRKENRDILAPLWDEFNNQGLQIIAYGLESSATAWEDAVTRDGANRWLQTSDLQGDDSPFLKKIRVQTIPANFILDEKGVIIAKNVHRMDLVDFVKKYINKK